MAACVVCGAEFRKLGKSITCSSACREVRNEQTWQIAKRRYVASGRSAKKQREWRKKNPDAPCLERERERHKTDHYKAVNADWRRRNRERIADRCRERYWTGGGKKKCAERFARKQAAVRLIRELQNKGLEALL